jgi:hypothetical protein
MPSTSTEAAARLAALESGAPFHPDRLPSVMTEASPLLVVITFTRPSAEPGEIHMLLNQTIESIKTSPGLISQRAAISTDSPPMFMPFTWWKDKAAVNAFYYSDLHQSLAGARGRQITGGTTLQADQVPTQMAVEILAPLAGGMQMGGGLIPRGR